MAHDNEPAKLIADTLKDAGSSNFAVNGGGTPKVFTYSPPADYDVVLHQFSFLIETSGAIAFGNKFVDTGIATLANGLLLECKANDLAFNWQNMKRTRDIIEICDIFDIITGTPNFIRVKVKLPHELRLVKAGIFTETDYLRLTVRDNLNTITFAEAHFLGSKL